MVSPFVADTSVRETRQSTMNSTNRPPKERFQMDGLSHLTRLLMEGISPKKRSLQLALNPKPK